MLVLSRRLNEKVRLPGIGASIQVVDIKHGCVRLGIEAPPEVVILREELAQRAAEWQTPVQPPAPQPQEDKAELCQALLTHFTSAAQGLGLARLQMDAGLLQEASSTLMHLQDDLRLLRYGIAGEMAAAPAAVKAVRPQKALLVEDDHNERELLAGFLRQAGLDVDTVADGRDALDYLHTQAAPDVVLLDMGLPRVDGPTMVRELRGDPTYAGLKIFGVTGHLPEEFDLERGPRGINRWFQKPLDPTSLLHDLTEELNVRRVEADRCCANPERRS
jgi:carbon storage regulator CsrA